MKTNMKMDAGWIRERAAKRRYDMDYTYMRPTRENNAHLRWSQLINILHELTGQSKEILARQSIQDALDMRLLEI